MNEIENLQTGPRKGRFACLGPPHVDLARGIRTSPQSQVHDHDHDHFLLLPPSSLPSILLRDMAGLVHPTPQFGFHPAPVNHSPSPLGFGFGLTSSHPHSAWQPQSQTALLAHSSSSTPSASHSYSKHAQKRRLDDNEDELRDESMDRSPTPERTRRIIAKRTRVFVEQASHSAGNEDTKASKDAMQPTKASDGVDVGMLLGESSLTSRVLTSLITVISEPSSTVVASYPHITARGKSHA